MTRRAIGKARPWEETDALTLCWAGAAAGDVERHADDGYMEPPIVTEEDIWRYSEPQHSMPFTISLSSAKQREVIRLLEASPGMAVSAIVEQTGLSQSYVSTIRQWWRTRVIQQEAA
jgi:hypothetical protein